MDVREGLVELFYDNNVRCDQKIEGLADDVMYIISNVATEREWISVDDRLPEEKANYIVYYKHAFVEDENHIGICICFYDGDEFEMDFLHKVTHWMPLPHPPKGE